VTPHDDGGNKGRTELDADNGEEGGGEVEEAADVEDGHCVDVGVRVR